MMPHGFQTNLITLARIVTTFLYALDILDP